MPTEAHAAPESWLPPIMGQWLVRSVAVRLDRREGEIGADFGVPVAGERPIVRIVPAPSGLALTSNLLGLARPGRRSGLAGLASARSAAPKVNALPRAAASSGVSGVSGCGLASSSAFAGGSGASTTEPRASCAAAGAAMSAHAKAAVVHAAQIVALFRIPNISPDPPDRNVPAHGRRRPVKHWLPCRRELWRRCEAPKSCPPVSRSAPRSYC